MGEGLFMDVGGEHQEARQAGAGHGSVKGDVGPADVSADVDRLSDAEDDYGRVALSELLSTPAVIGNHGSIARKGESAARGQVAAGGAPATRPRHPSPAPPKTMCF